MRRNTLVSMIITIILFVAAILLIAFGVNMVANPVSYHLGHGFFSYSVRYVSPHSIQMGSILFSLGRVLLISSFIMLGFTLYFSSKKEDAVDAKVKDKIKKEKKVVDAEIVSEENENERGENS